MAAGTKCFMRLQTMPNQCIEVDPFYQNFLQKYKNIYVNQQKIIIKYQGTGSNGYTQLSIPNAVFNGTSVSVPLGIVSSDAKDTSDGVGARTIILINQDSNGVLKNTTITMGGDTVITEDSFPKRIFHAYMDSVGSENDPAGNITIYRRAFDSMTDIAAVAATADSGLTAATAYYWKVNTDGGGVTEYNITTGTDTAWTAVLILMNAEMVSESATATITDGYLRFTSDVGTSIATTAGSTGTDLLATAGGTTAANTAYELYLTMAAAATETEGCKFWVDTDVIVHNSNHHHNITTATAVNRKIQIKIPLSGFGSLGSAADFTPLEYTATQEASSFECSSCSFKASSDDASVDFYETYIGGAENFDLFTQFWVYSK